MEKQPAARFQLPPTAFRHCGGRKSNVGLAPPCREPLPRVTSLTPQGREAIEAWISYVP